MKTFNRNLKIGFGLSIVLLIASAGASYRSVKQLITNMKWVDHTNAVSIELNQVLSALKDSETGMRGYLLTGEDAFLEPYKNVSKTIGPMISKVSALTADNALQRRNIRALRQTAVLEMNIQEHLIQKRGKGNSINTDSLNLGKFYMDRIRGQVDAMNGIEQRLLKQRSSDVDAVTTFALVFIAVASLLSIIITVYYYVRITNNIDQSEKMKEQLQEKKADLERQIEVIKKFADKVANGEYSERISRQDLEKKKTGPSDFTDPPDKPV